MSEAQPVLIKRYPNRRLYDTSARKYVNLRDVAALVRTGVDIRVVDARTGEDLTRLILTQVIVEDAKEQPSALPLELLRQLIVASDHAGREFLTWYLSSAFDTYQKVQSSVENRIAEVRTAALSPLNLMKNLFVAPPGGDVEVAELRQRVAELESRLKSKPAARQPRKRTKK